MTFEMQRRWGLCAALLLVGASGCDQGSVGEFEETDGEAGSASQGPTSGASQGSTAGPGTSASSSDSMTTAGSSSTGGVSSSTTQGSSESGLLLDVGDPAICENPLHGCALPVECGDSCGALDSMFDENGCVRVACTEVDACAEGEFCYRPMDYGGCQSSDLSCNEFGEGECGCGSLPDCGGAYCVPEEIVFGGIVEGPTGGLASNGCAPDDGLLSVISVGTYVSDACGGVFDPGPLLQISVEHEFGAQGTTTSGDGVFVAAQYSTDGTPETTQSAQWVVLHITQWDATVAGNYEVLLEDETLLVGTFATVVSCPSDPMCG